MGDVMPSRKERISAMQMCIHKMTETEKDRLIALLIAECNWSAEFMAAVRTAILECYERMGDKEPRKTGFLPDLLRSGE